MLVDLMNEGLLAHMIGHLVSQYLLNTNRVQKSIELCNEHLFLLNKTELKNTNELVTSFKTSAYRNMILGYTRINDYGNVIKWGQKGLGSSRESGDRIIEGAAMFILATSNNILCNYNEAKELCAKALSIGKETGKKELEALCYKTQGHNLKSLGEYVEAKEYFEKGKEFAKAVGDWRTEATCCSFLGDTCTSLCEYVKAKESFENALVILRENGDKELEAQCYGRLGDSFQSLCEYVKAKESFENALVIARKNGYKKVEATCHTRLGDTFLSLCEYVKAKESFENALVIAGENGNKELEARCYERLGDTFQSLCQYVNAKESYENALAIAEKNGYKELEAQCYGELGQTFWSLHEYAKAKESLEKALVIAKENGNKKATAMCYGRLGGTFKSLGEYVKAKESFENALEIAEENGYRELEAECYQGLGQTFNLLCDYVSAKEYYENSLAIARKISYKKLEAICYQQLGDHCNYLSENVKAIENFEKAHAIAEEIGDIRLQFKSCASLGSAFKFGGKHFKAKEYFDKCLAIAKKKGDWVLEVLIYSRLADLETIGEDIGTKECHEQLCAIAEELASRRTEAACFGNQRATYEFLRSDVKAKGFDEKAIMIASDVTREDEAEVYRILASWFMSYGNYTEAAEYFKKALALYRQIGNIGREIWCNGCISQCMMKEGNIPELKSLLLTSINKSEGIRNSLQGHDKFKVSVFERFVDSYRVLGRLLCDTGNHNDGLYIEDLGRARALADLMSAQYSVEKQTSVDLQKWVGPERILQKESNCACLYISYYNSCIILWGLTVNNPPIYQHKHVYDYFKSKKSVDDVFCSEIYKKVRCLASERCEDRSWFPSNAYPDKVCESSQEESLAASRLTFSSEVDEDEEQPMSTLADVYKMIIAPVASLLDKSEIIIVPDRLFFKVPFVALKNESGNYLSENIRIRIVPSLTTLQVIQDSPANYHSQTGALIVGDPDVGEVLYKGNLCQVSRLPFAGEEAEMIGKLLDAQPLLGKRATKEAVLNNINSVSLIHFACHGDAERGEIVLAPPTLTDRKPQEDDYLLRMADISQVQLRAKLVVLSCCHSAEGQISAEGVVGIARAFIGSGARSVLAALWAIDDEATKQLMSRFYEHLVRGESASESLHQAMKWMRANGFSEVERWAPFMLIGDNVTLDVHKLRLVETD